MSLVALHTRRLNKRLSGIKIAWHEYIPFEIQGHCTIKQGLGDFAIADIAITNNLQQEEIQSRKPNWILCCDMSTFGMR